MALLRFTETDTKRVAYGMTLAWLSVGAAALVYPVLAFVAAVIGFPAGLCMGRLTEARERAKGSGVIIGK